MSFELASCLVTLFLLAGIGTPIGYSIMLASVVYLGFSGLDVALAGEKILQGFYLSTILIAVPLFIVAANIMNAGTITDRLLNFCVAAVGRFKGGLGACKCSSFFDFFWNVWLCCCGCCWNWKNNH